MKRTKEDAEQTRENILNAAIGLFADKGVAPTTLEDIAKAAHVTRGAIYWHFKNKLEIFDALHERLHRPLVDMIMEDVEKDHPEPLEQLKTLCIKLLQELEHDIPKRQALALFLVRCDYSGELASYKDKHNEKKAESLKLSRRYFEKARQMGKLPAGAEPELLTLAVSCYMKGILLEYLDNPDGFDIARKAPALIGLFFKNMGA